jgi:hypothetical protein
MKNKDIHVLFEGKEIRDFLAKSLKVSECGSSPSFIEKEIKKLEEELKKAKQFEGAMELIKKQGWEEFDVSNEIEDYNSDTYFPFIGTEEEAKQIKFGEVWVKYERL